MNDSSSYVGALVCLAALGYGGYWYYTENEASAGKAPLPIRGARTSMTKIEVKQVRATMTREEMEPPWESEPARARDHKSR
jgi:uncharacterized membrane protein YebE (DUF533 family)